MLKLLIVFISIISVANFAMANDQRYASTECEETQVRINEVPLPRQSQLVVRWEGVSGFWTTDDYVFELGKVVTRNGKRFISVRMLDSRTREAVKKGGVAVRTDGLRASGILTDIKPANNGRLSDDTFLIFRAFKELDSSGRPTNRDLFVVTIRTLREKVRVCEETHHQLVRPSIESY